MAAGAGAGVQIASRLAAAVLGGYALAAALAVFLGAALPAARADAVLAGVQWGIVAHVGAVVWAFSPMRFAWAWAGLLLPAGVLGALGLWLAPA